MATVNMVPCLANELVVHVDPVRLQVASGCSQLFIRQSWRVILSSAWNKYKFKMCLSINLCPYNVTLSEKRSRSNSFLTAACSFCSGVALVHRNHCWVRLGPTKLFRFSSVTSSFSMTERSTNCTAESHCCLSWTERSSSVLSWITRNTSAACQSLKFSSMFEKRTNSIQYLIFPLVLSHWFVNNGSLQLVENVVVIFR